MFTKAEQQLDTAADTITKPSRRRRALEIAGKISHEIGNLAWRAAFKLGSFAVRHRVGLTGTVAGLTGVVTIGAAIKGAGDMHVYETYKNMFATMADMPSTTIEHSNLGLEMTVGSASAGVSVLSSMSSLAMSHFKTENAAYATPEGQERRPNSAPRHGTRSITELRAAVTSARESRARLMADLTAHTIQESEKLFLAQEIVESFGGTPPPTTTVYYSDTFQPGYETPPETHANVVQLAGTSDKTDQFEFVAA